MDFDFIFYEIIHGITLLESNLFCEWPNFKSYDHAFKEALDSCLMILYKYIYINIYIYIYILLGNYLLRGIEPPC